MTDEYLPNLRDLLEKTADTDFLREMIGFTAQRLMELEVGSLDWRSTRQPSPQPPHPLHAIANHGKPAPAPSSCVDPSARKRQRVCALSNHGGWPRRH